MLTTSARASKSSLATSVAPTSAARGAVRFWLQAITSISNARPTLATRDEPAESDDAEGLAVQAEPAAHLPPALARGAILGRDAANEGEDEAPRQLGRRVGEPRGPADDDPALHGRAHVDRRVAHSRRHQELEPR